MKNYSEYVQRNDDGLKKRVHEFIVHAKNKLNSRTYIEKIKNY